MRPVIRLTRATLAAAIVLAAACARRDMADTPTDSAANTAATNPPATTTAAPSAAPDAVPVVTSIKCTISRNEPAQLGVIVTGEVPTGGWTNPTLTPRDTVTQPADGIWEYDFTASRPTGMATQAITPIMATHLWPGYPEASLKGIRVFGAGGGVKESTIGDCTKP